MLFLGDLGINQDPKGIIGINNHADLKNIANNVYFGFLTASEVCFFEENKKGESYPVDYYEYRKTIKEMNKEIVYKRKQAESLRT